MSLLSGVKEMVNFNPALEEANLLAELEEDDDFALEAMLYGEDSDIGDGDSDEGLDEEDLALIREFSKEDILGDPDLGEDEDSTDFTFESAACEAVASMMGDGDEEEDFDEMLDSPVDGDNLNALLEAISTSALLELDDDD